MSLTVVGRIVDIQPHPNADRLEIIHVEYPIRNANEGYMGTAALVTGKHYQTGDLGVWLMPGGVIDGELARHLWLVGKEKASDSGYRFVVKEIPMRGVPSPGLWLGEYYQTDSSAESHDHARELLEFGGTEVFRDGESWIRTPYWDPDWRVGDEVDEDLGVMPVLGPPSARVV